MYMHKYFVFILVSCKGKVLIVVFNRREGVILFSCREEVILFTQRERVIIFNRREGLLYFIGEKGLLCINERRRKNNLLHR